MSDNWLRYVPTDPQYQPTVAQATGAEQLLASFLPQSEEVRSEFTEHAVFVDPGSNWSGVHCPSCGEDAEAWWGEAMSAAAEANFTNLTTVAPCCSGQVSLNELNYNWPCAIGRYVLEAMNPNQRGLAPEQAKLLAIQLGCDIREVPVHL
jgi:hypothetical protein